MTLIVDVFRTALSIKTPAVQICGDSVAKQESMESETRDDISLANDLLAIVDRQTSCLVMITRSRNGNALSDPIAVEKRLRFASEAWNWLAAGDVPFLIKCGWGYRAQVRCKIGSF